VVGLVLLLPGLGLLGAGGTLLWVDWTSRSDGFVNSPSETFSSQGYALVSDRIDLQTDADWLPISAALGTARVEVTGPGQDEIFVGIAPNADVTAGLQVVARVGAEFPALTGIAWGVLIGGLVLTVIAVVLLVIAIRTPRDRRPPMPPSSAGVPSPRSPADQPVWGQQTTPEGRAAPGNPSP
jgi:hypothetical protein